jgi:hypothetical protein
LDRRSAIRAFQRSHRRWLALIHLTKQHLIFLREKADHLHEQTLQFSPHNPSRVQICAMTIIWIKPTQRRRLSGTYSGEIRRTRFSLYFRCFLEHVLGQDMEIDSTRVFWRHATRCSRYLLWPCVQRLYSNDGVALCPWYDPAGQCKKGRVYLRSPSREMC